MKRSSPPKLFHRFFRWYCNPLFRERIEGDLLEIYHENTKRLSEQKANMKFIVHVIQLFRPTIIRPFAIRYQITPLSMYKNYLKIASRNLTKNKAFSAINIAGLSMGLTCSLLIGLWVNDELHIDTFHHDIDRIFLVTSCEYSGTEITGTYDTPGLLGEELPKVFPEIQYASNYAWTQFHTFGVGDKKMKLPGNFAGEDFFKIFSYPIIAGSKDELLTTPESVVISRKMATNFFGSPEAALDKTLLFETYKDLKITGVFEDLGDNASDKFEYIISWHLMLERNEWLKNWGNSGPYTVVKLRAGSSGDDLQGKIQHFLKNYNSDYGDLERLELGLQPYADHYLKSNFENGKISGGRIEYVNLFRFVAFFIMIIACINFMNLSTARSMRRAREIGVRKAIGAIRSALITQFTVEAVLFTAIAIVIALGALIMILPFFNQLTGKNIAMPYQHVYFWGWIAILTILTGILSGSYPALVLSSLKPTTALKLGTGMKSSSGILRKTLVVFQFSLSMIFIVGMVVVSKQVDYIRHKNLGYDNKNMIYLSITGKIGENFEGFKNEALQLPGIVNLTKMNNRPFLIDNSTASVEWEGKDANARPTFTNSSVGFDFTKAMDIKILLGRDFSEEYADSTSYIINETALRTIGYKEPIGMPLTLWGQKGTIVGIIKDFHFNSLHVPIRPMILRLSKKSTWGWLIIRTDGKQTSTTLASLKTLYERYSPDVPFAHQFADEELGFLYQREILVQELSKYFALIAVLVSSLGLFGLVLFAAEQRIKEVGIRKVLGASVSEIVKLLSEDFMRLILIAVLVSFPSAYYVTQKWLEGFEYHIKLEWWMFLMGGAGGVVVAFFTIAFQAFRSASANPVSSLKTE